MLNEILIGLGINEDTLQLGFKCTVLGRRGVYIEGVKKVLKFSEKEITLKVKEGEVEICGNNLQIKSMTKTDIIVSGEILKVVLCE